MKAETIRVQEKHGDVEKEIHRAKRRPFHADEENQTKKRIPFRVPLLLPAINALVMTRDDLCGSVDPFHGSVIIVTAKL